MSAVTWQRPAFPVTSQLSKTQCWPPTACHPVSIRTSVNHGVLLNIIKIICDQTLLIINMSNSRSIYIVYSMKT